MKTLALFLAFAVVFICGMYANVALKQHRAMTDQYQVEYQADMVVGDQE